MIKATERGIGILTRTGYGWLKRRKKQP